MNNPNQLSGLKGRMISEVEQVVNDLRKRIDLNRTELEQLEAQHQEARTMLQLLKTGKTNASRVQATEVEYLEAIATITEEGNLVDTSSLIDLLGVTQGGATAKLRELTQRGILNRVSRGKYTPVERNK